jgi:hypothetical protein
MPPRRTVPESPIYTFRIRILGGFSASAADSVWREIEIAASQTLADLGKAIPLAFAFDDPHLWSFFLSGKAWDRSSEYALSGRGHAARRVQIKDVPLPGTTGKKEFLFLFDYGDEWRFGVRFVRTRDHAEPGARYPRVAASHGEAPPQYPDVEDDWEEEN